MAGSHRGSTDPLTSSLRLWQTFTTTAMQCANVANRAAVDAIATESGTAPAPARARADGPPASIPSLDYEADDWSFERTVDDPDDIEVGDRVTFTKRISDDDVRAFATASGDTNRLHLDDEFAARTRFGGRIVHGTLVSGMISAALARLPGLTIYLSQSVEFRAPVDVGTTLTALVEVVEDLGDSRFRLTTTIEMADGTTVIEGDAVVLIEPVEE